MLDRLRRPHTLQLIGSLAAALIVSGAPITTGAAGPAGDQPGSAASLKPAAPARGHDVTQPWITKKVANEVALSGATGLPSRTAVKPLPRGAARSLAPASSAVPTAAAGTALKREVFGFAAAGSLGDPNVGYRTWDFTLLSTVAYFGLRVNGTDGSLIQGDTGWNVWQSSTASDFINAAHASGVRVVVSLIYQDTTSGMCTALDHGSNTINQVAGQLKGADGINIDYEGAPLTCPGNVSLRTKVVGFVQSMRAAALGYLSIDTYAGSAEDQAGFFDIPSLAGSVDSFFVMDYDLELANGPCAACIGPTSPLAGAPTYAWNVTRSANGYRPWAGQTILGFPAYGVKGCVQGPNPPPNAPVTSNFGADAYVTIVTYPSDPKITFWQEQRDAVDPTGEEPWASFNSAYVPCWREEYWDDAVSLGHKYDLVNQYDMRGAGMFTLDYMGGSAELWNTLRTHFALVPASPTNVTACPGDGFATVAWSPAASASPVISYTVSASPGGAAVSVAGNSASATLAGLANGTPYTFTVRATNAYGPGPASAPSAALTPGPPPGSWPGRLHPVTPARILDTRIGLGYSSKLGPGTRIDVPVVGQGGIPANGVSAVVLNATAVDQTLPSFLTLSASGACVLGFSNLNFVPGGPAANLTIVPVAANGAISVYNLAGSVDVVADVFGWIGGPSDAGPSGHLQPVTPTRILDTRLGTQGIRTLGPGQIATVSVTGQNGLPSSGVSAVALNLTATNTTASTYVSLWPDGQPPTGTSNLNLLAGQTRANRVIVPLGANGKLDLLNFSGSTDVIVDVTGWFTDASGSVAGGVYQGLVPVRLLDTRSGLGAPPAPLGPGQWLTVKIAGGPGLPASGISAVVVNLTVTNPSQNGYLEVNQSGQFSGTSDLNFVAGQTIPNLVVSPVDASGQIHIFNFAGTADVIVDILGWF